LEFALPQHREDHRGDHDDEQEAAHHAAVDAPRQATYVAAMTPTLDTVYEEALSLPEALRLELVERLLPTITGEPEIETAQFAIVQQRRAEVESGRVQMIPGEDVFREVNEALAAKRG